MGFVRTLSAETLLPVVPNMSLLRVGTFSIGQISPVTETLLLQLMTQLSFHEVLGHTFSVRQECSTAVWVLRIIDGINAGEGDLFD